MHTAGHINDQQQIGIDLPWRHRTLRARYRRHIINDGHIQRGMVSTAIFIGCGDSDGFVEIVDAVGTRVVFTALQGVGIGHHTRARVVTRDGQRVTQRGSPCLREANRIAATDHGDTAYRQGLQTIRGRYAKASRLGQRRGVWTAAVAEVFLIDRQLATLDVQAIDDDRMVQVTDVDLQRCSAAVAIGVLEGVGKAINTTAATVQVDEILISGVQRVGVGAVGGQHQLAVDTVECLRRNRSARNTVGALGIVGQHVTSHGQLGFGGRGAVGVIEGFRRVVDDVYIDVATGRAAIVVSRDHGEAFAQGSAVTAGVLFVVEQRIGVGHHAGGRVVASDGQRIAQRGRSRLREAARAVADHRDPFNGQGFQAIRCMHGEAAALGQCRSTRTTAIAQVFLINSQFAAFDIQAFQGHRVVEVIDVDLQRRGATVAVGILEGVGEGFNAGASTVDEVRVGSV
ncbi:hypothetical protein D3C72_982390 [compost metagenome]